MADFTMPALGADMETGKLVQWHVKPGDTVHAGDVVAVVETHKGAIDVECFLDGVIDNLAPLDTDLPVGTVLATVRGSAAPASAPPAPASVPSSASSPMPPAAAPMAAPAASPPPVAATDATGARVRAKVSPAARSRAAALGVSVDGLSGSGVDGAVTLADVARAMSTPPTTSIVPTAPAPVAPLASPKPRVGFDPAQMRQAIAAAMGRSKREIPHYYLGSTIDFGAAQTWLDAWNRQREPVDRLLPAVLLLKATARALEEVPQLSGFYENGVYRPSPAIHVGWAVALRGGGLVAPAIHDANHKTLPALMAALRDLVQRARAGGLRSSELTDPTITVTSLGDRGAESVLGVIYPPQVAIVGFGRVVQRPWVVDGQIVPRPLVSVTLAADHRASDGHVGGQLLAAIDTALQHPDRL
ncbi:dihydrolipoamide acetyltransferase family protein [Rhodoferax sp.]|uniref:dihydrolipoamide acetyltransferase family protein n=1 Tax=Rhodoferax sp. TaxID=50421 RepID=UPI002635122D|nr:dihydrolipoamide acetyltransferase family protein [Rhodoferax sp.]MDD2925412.1 dihydrolipoamide acetyltransferase family protein [Rhodoferax sp.]